jgi:hypothetical protein
MRERGAVRADERRAHVAYGRQDSLRISVAVCWNQISENRGHEVARMISRQIRGLIGGHDRNIG